MADSKRKPVLGLDPNVFFLGVVSFLTDISSELIFTLMPLFLANVLGAGTVVIGFIEGVADSTA
ncbi:MAG: MFS transporter, partial [Dehalococcoidia bacterium]